MRLRRHTLRHFATCSLALTAVLVAGTGCGGSSNDDQDRADGKVELRFSWWGNNERAKLTQQAIDAFETKNPRITVKGEFTDYNGYFDRLATSTAAGDAPDIITLGGAYPREYGDRGVLLDLSRVRGTLKTDDLDQAALGDGKFSGKQYGVPTGVNTYAVVADPVVFEKAGVPLPDDSSWTWDDFLRIAKEIATKSPKGTYGVPDFARPEVVSLLARQRGGDMYTTKGKVALTERDLVDLWTRTADLRAAQAAPSASLTAELVTQPAPEQSLIGRGLAGMQFEWSNQLTSLRKASGHPLKLLRAPGESSAKRPGMWLQASQLYTINAKSKHVKEAARFVDFLINSERAGKIILADRGIPANAKVRAAIESSLDENTSAQLAFIKEASKYIKAPQVIGPTGSTDSEEIIKRINAEVLFDRQDPSAAARQVIKEINAAIER